MKEILVKSSIDSRNCPSLFYYAGDSSPLLVGLHTWSADRTNQVENMLPWAKKLGWSLLLPEFRGPNLESNPACRDACGSLLAKQDILDAVDYVCGEFKVDFEKVFLLGASGGGHMALLMSGFAPERWFAAGAFVGITDLKKWYYENPNYTKHIHACCGGSPEEAAEEYEYRSPITYAEKIARANLKIFHGKYDKSVPFTHSVNLYNEILKADPNSRTFLEIFDGGHEMPLEMAFSWFLSQINEDEGGRFVTG